MSRELKFRAWNGEAMEKVHRKPLKGNAQAKNVARSTWLKASFPKCPQASTGAGFSRFAVPINFDVAPPQAVKSAECFFHWGRL